MKSRQRKKGSNRPKSYDEMLAEKEEEKREKKKKQEAKNKQQQKKKKKAPANKNPKPPKGKETNIGWRVDRDIYEQVKEIAVAENRELKDVLTECLKDMIDKKESEGVIEKKS